MQTQRIGGATLSHRGPRATDAGQVSKLRILWAGPIAVLTAVAATLVARAIAVAVLPPLNPAFIEMAPQSIAIFTSFLCTVAVGVFTLVAFISRRPLRTFAVVSAVALVLSWIPDLMLFTQPEASAGGIIALMVLHAVAAVTFVYTLSVLTGDAWGRGRRL
jgi:Family of unknown function (DUF6069)